MYITTVSKLLQFFFRINFLTKNRTTFWQKIEQLLDKILKNHTISYRSRFVTDIPLCNRYLAYRWADTRVPWKRAGWGRRVRYTVPLGPITQSHSILNTLSLRFPKSYSNTFLNPTLILFPSYCSQSNSNTFPSTSLIRNPNLNTTLNTNYPSLNSSHKSQHNS